LAYVALVTTQHALDKVPFHFFKTHVFQTPGAARAIRSQAEIGTFN
jgi:hypothetical protein